MFYLQDLFKLLITPSITSIKGNFSPEAIVLLLSALEALPIPCDRTTKLPIQIKYNEDYCVDFHFTNTVIISCFSTTAKTRWNYWRYR
ncbi:hypothetical protein G6F42_021454 [Rhizopus arrhizus]|nr:hypothetical protein G6F42_021454 [Rhizopus arrhizus]